MKRTALRLDKIRRTLSYVTSQRWGDGAWTPTETASSEQPTSSEPEPSKKKLKEETPSVPRPEKEAPPPKPSEPKKTEPKMESKPQAESPFGSREERRVCILSTSQGDC